MNGTLALDLGSSTTVVAWQAPGEAPRLLPLPPYSAADPALVPSVLWLRQPDDPRPLLGQQVLDADLLEHTGPGLCRDFKRHIGGTAAEGVEPAAGPWLAPEAAAALLVRRLWQALPPQVQPERLVLTAPVETYRGYRAWLQELCSTLPVQEEIGRAHV